MKALRLTDSVLTWVAWVAAAFAVLVLFAGPSLIGAKHEGAAVAPAYGSPSSAPAPAAGADGKAVFAKAGCGGCHTLSAAGATGTTGPNLDEAHPDQATVKAIVTSGAGIMPSFKGKLSDAEIAAVADYVASATK